MTVQEQKDTPKTPYILVGEYVRIFKRGNRWYANFQHDGKQQRRSLGTTNQKEARRRAIQIDADISRGAYTPAVKPATVSDVLDAYCHHLRAERRSAKTLTKYTYVFELVRDLAARRKSSTIGNIDLAFVDAFRAERTEGGAAPKTVYNDTVIVRQLVNFALRRGMIGTDPLKGLRLSKPKPTPQPCWQRTELQRIIDGATEPYRSVFIGLAETGMRIGELKHLAWEDVDLESGVVHIRPKNDWRPKTGDIRVIPLSPVLRSVLVRLPRKAKWVFTAKPSWKYPKRRRPSQRTETSRIPQTTTPSSRSERPPSHVSSHVYFKRSDARCTRSDRATLGRTR